MAFQNESKHIGALFLLENVSQTTLSAVLAIVMPGHENTSTAFGVGAFATKTGDLAGFIDFIVLKNSELDLSLLVLDLLGGSISLLLTLLTTTQQLGIEVKSAVVLDTVQSESILVLQRLASVGETLKTDSNAFTFLNHGLNGLNGGISKDIQSKGVASEGFDENLHVDLFKVIRYCSKKDLK